MGVCGVSRGREVHCTSKDESGQGQHGARFLASRRSARNSLQLPQIGTADWESLLLNLFNDEGLASMLDLPPAEQELRCRQQLAGIAGADEMPETSPAQPITREVPADGDCFFHSLIEMAGEHLRDTLKVGPTPHDVRSAMADGLAERLVQLNAAVGSNARTRELLKDAPYLAVVPTSDQVQRELTAAQRTLVDQVRTDGSWDTEAGDLFPSIAADALGLQLEVITPYTNDQHRLVHGRAGQPSVHLVRRGVHYEPVVAWS